MFRFFHGDAMPDWVMGQARVRDRRGFGHAMEDHAAVVMQFPGGGRAVLEVGPSWLPDSANMVLTGTQGMIIIRNERELSVFDAKGARREDYTAQHDFTGIWSRMFDTLAEWIDGGQPPALAFDHVAGTAELNLGCYLSMVEGDRIDFPLSSGHDEWPVEELARRKAGK